jgi:hypothetical protein
MYTIYVSDVLVYSPIAKVVSKLLVLGLKYSDMLIQRDFKGATKLSITAQRIITISIMTQHNDTRHNDTQKMILSMKTPSITRLTYHNNKQLLRIITPT